MGCKSTYCLVCALDLFLRKGFRMRANIRESGTKVETGCLVRVANRPDRNRIVMFVRTNEIVCVLFTCLLEKPVHITYLNIGTSSCALRVP